MACYFVYGTLGAGKGIFLAKKMKEYLARGSRVATNVDLFPENLCPNTKEPISRIPSVFRLEDLDQLGRGCSEDEKVNLGGLFLDEGVFWLNARDWNAKGRKELIQKLVMIRKLGWDIWIAVQDPESVDKQALNALGEHFVCCTRLDHFRIPIISPIYDFYRLVKSKGREQSTKILPHINRASYRRGKTKQGNKPYFSETYRPKDFFGTYDTNQIFQVDYEDYDLRQVDMRASFSYIPGSTLKQWYKPDLQLSSSNSKKVPLLSMTFFFIFLA
ncbi:TPA: zonular occludens toxin domain-containing protein, partial [Vibrio parahaemolyticus]